MTFPLRSGVQETAGPIPPNDSTIRKSQPLQSHCPLAWCQNSRHSNWCRNQPLQHHHWRLWSQIVWCTLKWVPPSYMPFIIMESTTWWFPTGPVTCMLFDPSSHFLFSTGDKHIHVMRNVVGYRAAILDLEEKAKKANTGGMRDRILQQVKEYRWDLAQIFNVAHLSTH